MTHDIAHQWRPIEDIDEATATRLGSDSLRSHMRAWEDQRRELATRASFDQFNQRLKRQWAIETGLIERLYTLDRGVTRLLVERGIDAALIPHGSTNLDSGKLVRILRDHEDAYESLIDWVKTDRGLTQSFIRELHALLTRSQDTTEAIDGFGQRVEVDLLKGAYKERPNNPKRPDGRVHEYCPPVHVESEMARLVDLHARHIAADYPVEVSVSWLHHRFTQIHPFQDGNGRVARALATMVLLKARWFPLVVRDDERAGYIDALECADQGDLEPFVELVATHQERAFLQAFSVSRDVLASAQLSERISAIGQTFEAKRKQQHAAWLDARTTAGRLHDHAFERAASVVEELLETVEGVAPEGFRAFADEGRDEDPSRNFWFRRQIITIARTFEYFANLDDYRSWVRIVLNGGSRAEIVISFHGVGSEFRGVMAASAFFYTKSAAENADDEDPPIPLSSLPFQFAYTETDGAVRHRFRRWFDATVERGLAQWQALI